MLVCALTNQRKEGYWRSSTWSHLRNQGSCSAARPQKPSRSARASSIMRRTCACITSSCLAISGASQAAMLERCGSVEGRDISFLGNPLRLELVPDLAQELFPRGDVGDHPDNTC